MNKFTFIFLFFGAVIILLYGSFLNLAVAQGSLPSLDDMECELLGNCPEPQNPPVTDEQVTDEPVVISEQPKEGVIDVNPPDEDLEYQPPVKREPVVSPEPPLAVTGDDNERCRLFGEGCPDSDEKPDCSIELNLEQIKCDKNHDELKLSWQSIKQDFDKTSESVLTLHSIVNQDEIDLNVDRCGCHLVELERAYKQSSIANINNLLRDLKHLYSCLSKINKTMLEDPSLIYVVSDSTLSDINNMIGLSYERIVKVCSFRERRIPKYKEYLEKISKACKKVGRIPDVAKCQGQK